MSVTSKVVTTIIVIATIALGGFAYFRYWFPYAEGTDSGELNYFSYQGLIFKTYEGKMIQSGFKSSTTNTKGLRSNEFVFSVKDKAVADSLMRCSGKQVELRWKRYFGTLPWRGNSQYIVYEILSVRESAAFADIPMEY